MVQLAVASCISAALLFLLTVVVVASTVVSAIDPSVFMLLLVITLRMSRDEAVAVVGELDCSEGMLTLDIFRNTNHVVML